VASGSESFVFIRQKYTFLIIPAGLVAGFTHHFPNQY
jgi:hypothetical protein